MAHAQESCQIEIDGMTDDTPIGHIECFKGFLYRWSDGTNA